ncbi:MAG: TonB-dependent receptor [Pseudomonadota bacterium]
MIRCLLSAAIATALSAMPALAAPDTDPQDAATELEAVVVTAQRRAEDARDVPLSLSVVEPEQVQAWGSGLGDVRVIGARVPSVQAESSFGRTFPRFYIRGLGNTDFDLNASQPVSLVYDDVVLENPTLKGFPVFDLDRIEVLRGPQGTLFGRNTPAGVIKFESVRPAREFGGFARLGAGQFGSLNLEGAVGGPVGEASAARLSVLYQDRDDYVRNTAIAGDERGGFTERALRGQWLLAPSDDLEVLFQVRARDLSGGSAIFQANLLERGGNGIRPGFDDRRLAQDALPALDVESQGASARVTWDLGGLVLSSITAWESVEMFARGDVDGGFGASFAPPFGPGFIPFPAESGDGIPDHRQLTQELRLASDGDGPWSWQVGGLWYDEALDIDNVSYDTLAASAENGRARQRQDHTAWALFGALDYALSDTWRFGGGVRWSDDRKRFTAQRLVSPIGAGPIGPIAVSPEDDDLSGNLSATWSPTDAINVYARYATGFRAPAIQGRLLFGDVVSVAESEKIRSFELGAKADLFERRARIGAALFRYEVDDLQLTAVGGSTNFNTLINAENATGWGAELDFEAYLTERLTLLAAASYNRTRLDDDALAVQPCGSPCTVLDPAGAAAGTVRIDGNPLPQAPEWIANLTLRYAQPLAGGELYVLTDWSYRGRVNFFLYESREFVGAPLLEGGLRLGYTWDDGRYEAALLSRNLLDEVEVVGGVDFNTLTGFTNEPRYVGAEFIVRFD